MNCNCKFHGFSKYYKTCTKFMHDFLNILYCKSKTKPIQKFCYYFQRFSLFSPDNTKSLQKSCNPFQNFCFLLQNITKTMQNFCIVIKNFCVQMQKSCKEWHHLNQIKTNSQKFSCWRKVLKKGSSNQFQNKKKEVKQGRIKSRKVSIVKQGRIKCRQVQISRGTTK